MENLVMRICPKMTSLPKASKLCSTCIFWAGARKIMPGDHVEVHPYSKGDCLGGGFQYASMAALATCSQWQLWPAAAPDSAPEREMV